MVCMQMGSPKRNSYTTYHTVSSMLCSTLIIIIIKKYSARQPITILQHVTINLIYGYTIVGCFQCGILFFYNRQYFVALYRTPYGAWVHCFWSRWDPCVHLMKLGNIYYLKSDVCRQIYSFFWLISLLHSRCLLLPIFFIWRDLDQNQMNHTKAYFWCTLIRTILLLLNTWYESKSGEIFRRICKSLVLLVARSWACLNNIHIGKPICVWFVSNILKYSYPYMNSPEADERILYAPFPRKRLFQTKSIFIFG